MQHKEYYLGLDMGTSSVGWAVTDKDYNLLRVKGKDMWGIREFEEANTSVERRSNRVARRRYQRDVVRCGLVRSYFDDAISAVDPSFFARLDNSFFFIEDKNSGIETKNVLFDDPDYTDSDYFREYPTIFHLRKELIDNPESHDVRMVYLAIINMFKHRGHFLNASMSADGDDRTTEEIFKSFVTTLSDTTGVTFDTNVDYKELEGILGSKEMSRTRKAEALVNMFGLSNSDKTLCTYIRLICGLKVDVKILFPESAFDGDFKYSITYDDFSYDERIPEIIENIGEDNYNVIESAKAVYDKGLLAGIMRGYKFLSYARVDSYEKHKKDLALLKSVIRNCGDDNDYNMMFREAVDGSYSAYVGSTNHNDKTRRNMKGRKQEDLYKSIKALLKRYVEEGNEHSDDINAILADIELGTFLPKQLTNENGVIPNQAHSKELRKIIDNASRYLSFLNDIDESGLSVGERIVRLFSFQIPYYIGPVSEDSEKNHGNGWVVRKEKGEVLPWNIGEKIDTEATSKRFIEHLVRECTYITGEKVLPKASLMYERYAVLNEINNIRINGERIPVQLKQEIYTDLYEKGKKVTRKQLEKYLVNRGMIRDSLELSGIDIAINNSLASYGKFLPIFGDRLKEDRIKDVVEDIIYLSTIYGDSKKMLKDYIEKRYSDIISENDIKRILGFKFKDWGRLSRELILLPGCDKSVGENVPLLRMMWETNYNMMELVHGEQFTYSESLAEKSRVALATLSEFTYDDLEEMYFSAPVKRMVWQTILIIREISKVLGNEPKRLFVEMTRAEDDKKQRTTSRKQQFLELYKKIKDEARDWSALIESADKSGVLKSKKMYLYLTQMGKCMYTGEEIDLDELFNNSIYDIDHIYPRHFVKDDNIANNLVLVKRDKNAKKSDGYPLSESILNGQKAFWKSLCDKNLITKEKYNRLTARNPFTEEQKADFIARQLVETSQGTKGVSGILKGLLKNTEIVYSKSRNVSDFRRDYDFPKSRLVNDFHHVNDAYLNIVVGNVYYTKFTQNPINFIRKDYMRDGQKYNLDRMFDWKVERNGTVAWIPGKTGTISTVRKVMSKNTPLLTRKSFEVHGALTNETLYSAKEASEAAYIPFKTSDPRFAEVTKYGGFTNVSGAYFFLVEHEVKNKRVRTIETVPLYLKQRLEKDDGALLEYCVNDLQLKNPSVRISKISYQSLLKKDGYYMYLSGRSLERLVMRNAVSMCLNAKWIKYIHKLEKSAETGVIYEDAFNKSDNEALYEVFVEKHNKSIYSKRPNAMGDLFSKGQSKFCELSIEDQCLVLLQILGLSIIGPVSADLSKIGGAKKSGVMLISKNISNSTEFKLINQSVTGLYEKEIDMLTV